MLLAIAIVPRRFFDNSLPEDGKQSRYPVHRPTVSIRLFSLPAGLHKQAAGAASSSSAAGYNELQSQPPA